MGKRFILSLSLAAGMIAAAMEVHAAQASAIDPKQPALEGCVTIDNAATPRMTMVQTPARAKHRVKETRPRQYFDKRMQVRGGLLPTVDLAAQAGSIDPVFPAMVFTLPNRTPISTGNWPATGRGLIRSADLHFVAISPLTGKPCATPPGRQAASASPTQQSPSPVGR
jgi:hypothetical protein